MPNSIEGILSVETEPNHIIPMPRKLQIWDISQYDPGIQDPNTFRWDGAKHSFSKTMSKQTWNVEFVNPSPVNVSSSFHSVVRVYILPYVDTNGNELSLTIRPIKKKEMELDVYRIGRNVPLILGLHDGSNNWYFAENPDDLFVSKDDQLYSLLLGDYKNQIRNIDFNMHPVVEFELNQVCDQ